VEGATALIFMPTTKDNKDKAQQNLEGKGHRLRSHLSLKTKRTIVTKNTSEHTCIPATRAVLKVCSGVLTETTWVQSNRAKVPKRNKEQKKTID
jgi:hypothetical protein